MQEINPTKAALMDLAEDIIQTKSFSNVSFQTLAKGVGIKKGSVYYHFESKDELGEAIIERATAQIKHAMQSIKSEPIVKQLHVYCNWFGKHIGAAEKLCPGRILLPVGTQARTVSKTRLRPCTKCIRKAWRTLSSEGGTQEIFL